MNALRTGNVAVDMLIAMSIPVLFQLMISGIAAIKPMWEQGELNWSFWRKPVDYREIEHKVTQNSWGSTTQANEDQRNNVLIKAIQMYIDEKKIQYPSAQVSLVSLNQVQRRWWGGDDDKENTPAGKLKKYRLNRKPPQHVWTKLGDGIELRIEEVERDKGEKAEKTQITNLYKFRSKTKGSVDKFIDEAYQWYLKELRSLEDSSRYLYEMQTNGDSKSDEGNSSNGSRHYKRYQLSDEKTFNSLFFDEKAKLLAMIDHFTNKTGKYAIEGYPHKLGLLLHGPPGTGKTSLIKALAQYTKRNIVNVPLARITTNQELMDIMFDQQYVVQGDEVPIKLGFKDVIFVMEDVDAASKVVHRRDGKTSVKSRTEVVLDDDKDAKKKKVTPWQLLVESNDDEVKELVKTLKEKSERLKEAAIAPELVLSTAAQIKMPELAKPKLSEEEEKKRKKKSAEELKKEEDAEITSEMSTMCEAASGKENYVKMKATALKLAVEGGCAIDIALEDVLLGIEHEDDMPPPEPVKLRRTSISYRNDDDDAPPPPEEDEEETGGIGMSGDLGMMMATMASMMPGNAGGGAGGGADAVVLPSAGSAYSLRKDKLNLSGLLNVLDGVVDTPERIVVMTTNYPDHLDPALIRPGRIDKKLLLSYMGWKHIAAMIEHYFVVKLSDHEKERIKDAICGNDEKGQPALNLTPAQVEQISAEHDELEEMLVALETMGLPPPTMKRSAVSSTVTTFE
jgi:chaperone BCS1